MKLDSLTCCFKVISTIFFPEFLEFSVKITVTQIQFSKLSIQILSRGYFFDLKHNMLLLLLKR